MTDTSRATVLVSGCFDLLHSGHVAFLESAANYGRVIVAVGSDRTVTALKGQAPWCSEAERLYLIRSLRMVDSAFVSQGNGLIDFETELRSLKPTYLIVNEDGDYPAKRALCQELGIDYIVLQRTPIEGLPSRSSSQVRQHFGIPYRVEIAGGWLDQPSVSSLHPGPVVVASIEAQSAFTTRSGLATSSRAAAMRFWGTSLPIGDPLVLAQQLFALENPPGTTEVAGSQDQIGILVPGLSRLHYCGSYWPSQIDHITDEATLSWLESVLFLVPLGQRPLGFSVRADERILASGAKNLATASRESWDAIVAHDARRLGLSLTACLRAQVEMFPAMLPAWLQGGVDIVRQQVIGGKFTGAGGGGYFVVASESKPREALDIRIRRPFLS